MKLSQFKALTFDCYGTLIDWEAGLAAALQVWARRHGLARTDDALISEYGHVEHTVETEHPGMIYSRLLGEVLRRMAKAAGKPCSEEEARAFGDSIKDWPAFPDSREALAYLKRHYKLVILSNVDRASFAHSNVKLGDVFDAVVTAQDVGSYKPDPRNFDAVIAAVAKLGVAKAEILHTAQSLFHDIEPGKRHGLATCWINRRAGKAGKGATPNPTGGMPKPDWEFPTLAAMAAAHQAGG
jgi:2-haloalkanoic acid dehalogenase type II